MKVPALLMCICMSFACEARARQGARPLLKTYEAEIAAAIIRAQKIYPVPAALVRAVIRQESTFNAKALSPAGARGLMQVMPANAARLGVTPDELWEPEKNVRAGVQLLALLLKQFDGDVVSALVGYNARPRAKFAPIPRNGETPTYVWRVLAFYEHYRCEERRDCPPEMQLASREGRVRAGR